MTSQHNSGSLSKEAEDPYQAQNFSDDFGIGTRQDEAEDEAEWLRQHGASGFSGFSGLNNVCIPRMLSVCLAASGKGTNTVVPRLV